MEKLRTDLKSARSHLTESSIKTYASILSSLYRKMTQTDKLEEEDIQDYFCKNAKKTIDFLKDLEPTKRKTVLSALTILCLHHPQCEVYRAKMKEDSNHVRENYTDEKTDKQEENWVEWDDVLSIHNQMGKEVGPLFTKKPLSPTDFNRIQDYVLLSLYVLNEPRRSEDYAKMWIRDYDKKDTEVNYIDKGNFIFQKYKTSSLYGTQKIAISPKLKTLLGKWIRLNTSPYLLVSPVSNKPLNQVQINQRLNKIFGKKVGSSMLRHSYLSKVYNREEMQKTATNMGNSIVEGVQVYAKR